jgi:hypothetical protein
VSGGHDTAKGSWDAAIGEDTRNYGSIFVARLLNKAKCLVLVFEHCAVLVVKVPLSVGY